MSAFNERERLTKRLPLEIVEVETHQLAVLVRNGQPVRQIQPGRYRFIWKWNPLVRYELHRFHVKQNVEVKEIVFTTMEGWQVRVSLQAELQLEDASRWMTFDKPLALARQRLASDLQDSLRQVGWTDFDNARQQLEWTIRNDSRNVLGELGLSCRGVAIHWQPEGFTPLNVQAQRQLNEARAPKFPMVSPNQKLLPATTRYCPYCKVSIPRAGAKYCGKCGRRL